MNLLKKIAKAFRGTPPPPPKPSCIYLMWEHNSWGNSIQWNNVKERRIYGWLKRKPRVGDLIKDKLNDGRIGVFRVIEVRPCRDPQDMFFATLADVGYDDELNVKP